jgi:hypothetical protein
LSFRAVFCFINPYYRLIWMTSTSRQLIRISDGLLYLHRMSLPKGLPTK